MKFRTSPDGSKRVTVIPGDGIGPEVVGAARRVVEATGVRIAWEACEAGATVFRRGLPTGVPAETIASIADTQVVLKGPLETPVGYGEKSANVTLRKFFETYGNLRPVRELPGVPSPFSGRGIDLIVVRENVEDLYAGIEHMQTPGVAQCLKLMSRKGCEKIVRLAFAVAVAQGRRTVHCATKANIMKQTEGLLKRTFEEIAQEFPTIEARHIIVDNCAHQLVRQPEAFDVIVTSNMNGDILSDLTSGLIGGLGFAPGANVGNEVCIYEAVHGSAPSLAGTNTANPTAVILSAAMMLRHLAEFEAARQVEDAVARTLEDGVHTRDVASEGWVSTTAFTQAVIDRLGQQPRHAAPSREHAPIRLPRVSSRPDVVSVTSRRTVGADIFVESGDTADTLGLSLEALVAPTQLRLKMISNRGTKVYPPSGGITDCVDHWRCRFVLRDDRADLSDDVLIDLLQRVRSRHRWMHIEKLGEVDGAASYTRAQGED